MHFIAKFPSSDSLPSLLQVALSGSNVQPINLLDKFSAQIGFQLDKVGLIGETYVPAELWPSQKLRPGTVAISEALSSMLGSPSPGEFISLHQLPEDTNSTEQCCAVVLQLCSNSGEKCGGSVPIAPRKHFSASSGGSQIEPSSPSPISPAQRGRISNQAPRASPPSMRGAGNSQPVPNLLGPSKENPSSAKKKGSQTSRSASNVEKKGSSGKDEPGNLVHLAAVKNLLEGET